MKSLPNREAYPKIIMLRDCTKVELRPLEEGDKVRLLHFFENIPEADRYYLKENVTAPEVIRTWTTTIDFDWVIPIVAVADATLHRSRAPARQHVGELRIVVAPDYREGGLGRRLIRELLDIAIELGLHRVTYEVVAQREKSAIMAAESIGFQEIARFKGRVRDLWGNYQDLVVMDLPMEKQREWWRF